MTDKVAVVTGAAGGVGSEVARRLAAAGAFVYAADHDFAACEPLAGEAPGKIAAAAFDATDANAIDVAMEKVVSARGGIDILVNCAGVYGMQFLQDVSEAEFDRILRVNLKGLLFATQAAARRMIARGLGGAIVNVASAAGRRPAPGSMAYSASKAGVISVTQGAALELAAHGIRVNAVAPGAIETPMWDAVKLAYGAVAAEEGAVEGAQLAATPLGRLCRPSDCADVILFFCSDQSAFVTGQTLNVDGGMYLN